MNYPKLWERFNNCLGTLSGALLFAVGFLQAMEAILRYLFESPTVWSMDVSRYILIWAIFLGAAYGFQEKSHVGVDVLQPIILRTKLVSKKTLLILGYSISIVFIGAILWRGSIMLKSALKTGKLTTAFIQIPIAYIYLAMCVGAVLMLITVILIILSIARDEKRYL